jgi:hypothetical protein
MYELTISVNVKLNYTPRAIPVIKKCIPLFLSPSFCNKLILFRIPFSISNPFCLWPSMLQTNYAYWHFARDLLPREARIRMKCMLPLRIGPTPSHKWPPPLVRSECMCTKPVTKPRDLAVVQRATVYCCGWVDVWQRGADYSHCWHMILWFIYMRYIEQFVIQWTNKQSLICNRPAQAWRLISVCYLLVIGFPWHE